MTPGNNADHGGGINNGASSPLLTNVAINGNSAAYGGGVYNYSSSPALTNVTISRNTATSGGGIFNTFNSFLKIRNTILYGNSDGIYNDASSLMPEIFYSLVQGPTDESNGNIKGDKDPMFMDADKGDFHLQPGSPAINTGDNAANNEATDLDGNLRKFGIIDLGPYENQVVLPVSILNFTAEAEGNRAKLKWASLTESNNKEFVISHSADGIHFIAIGSVAGARNSSLEHNYVFYDESPQASSNFYRLEQVDFDRRRTIIGVKVVNFAGLNKINIYPNPVKNLLRLDFTPVLYQKIELKDVNGRRLKEIRMGILENRKNLDMSSLVPGTYFIRLTGNEKVETRRVVKE